MASKTCIFMKNPVIFHRGQSWLRSMGFFSRFRRQDDASEKVPESSWGPEQEKKSLIHGKDKEVELFLDEPIPDYYLGKHLKDPVRATEREYFQTHQNPRWEGHAKGTFDSRFYSKKYGVSKEVQAWLNWDINLDDDDEIELWRRTYNFRMLKEDQRYLEERMQILGPELSAAHFVVARGGAVKFEGRDHWFVKDKHGNYPLPRRQVENLYVEAIDATKTDFTHAAFHIFDNLERLRYLKLKKCRHIDDWCLARLQRVSHSLEFLDLEGCDSVTDNGLSALQCLTKLRGLRLCEMQGVKHLGLIVLHLEGLLPGLQVLGVSESDLSPPAWSHRGERRLVRALLGCLDEQTDPDTFPLAEEVPMEDAEDENYTTRRLIRSAD